jgi:hypothetical protein
MRRVLGSGAAIALLASLLGAAPLAAQELDRPSPPLVKYGKWLLAAGAVGMNYLAAKAHDRAQSNFDALEDRCFESRNLCLLGDDGRYLNGGSEALYQESLRYDRQARRWLFGGETALVGAAAMFVWELTRHSPRPDNIPFQPELKHLRQATGVGLRLEF